MQIENFEGLFGRAWGELRLLSGLWWLLRSIDGVLFAEILNLQARVDGVSFLLNV